jgi:hypothetical protein
MENNCMLDQLCSHLRTCTNTVWTRDDLIQQFATVDGDRLEACMHGSDDSPDAIVDKLVANHQVVVLDDVADDGTPIKLYALPREQPCRMVVIITLYA